MQAQKRWHFFFWRTQTPGGICHFLFTTTVQNKLLHTKPILEKKEEDDAAAKTISIHRLSSVVVSSF
jgi:hypothetical protein